MSCYCQLVFGIGKMVQPARQFQPAEICRMLHVCCSMTVVNNMSELKKYLVKILFENLT